MVKRLLKLFNLTKVPPLAVDVYSKVSRAANGDFHSHIADDVAEESKRMIGHRILDVGTGPGYLPLNIARRTPEKMHLVGVDISEQMVNQARENARRMGIPPQRVYFSVANAERLPLYEEEFGFIVSTEVLHQVKDPVKMLNQMFRALKPGGKAWIYDTTSDISNTHLEMHLDMVRRRLLAGKMNRTTISWVTLLRKREILFESYTLSELLEIVRKSKFKECDLHRDGIWVKMVLKKPKAE
ncbi:Putative arsenite methyltransferase [uncultured archaeon]|nr:Putative arsenite methyltransferase [uncultured archaeon]